MYPLLWLLFLKKRDPRPPIRLNLHDEHELIHELEVLAFDLLLRHVDLLRRLLLLVLHGLALPRLRRLQRGLVLRERVVADADDLEVG